MKFEIETFIVSGINNPLLYFDGYFSNDVKKVVIKGTSFYHEEIVESTKCSLKFFKYEIRLSEKENDYEIIFVNDQEHSIKKFKTNKVSRLKDRLFDKSERFNTKLKDESQKNTFGGLDIECYQKWINEKEKFLDVCDYEYNPKISIVMPVYNVPGKYLGLCLDSILNQTYQNFEICIADDCSTNKDTIETLKTYMGLDSRIKVVFRKENGHISKATNSALEIADGEYIGLMDNDDMLSIYAFNEVVNVLNKDKTIDFIYSDEDKIDMQGNRSDPHFKSDFALDTLYGGNYICHFSVIRKSLINKINGYKTGVEGAQDFDLFLRLSEVTSNFYHIPKILYHWRMIPGSTAVEGGGAKSYASYAGEKALYDYFENRNLDVAIDNVIGTNYYVEYLGEQRQIEVVLYGEGDNSEAVKSIENSDYGCYHISCAKDVESINEIIKSSDAETFIFMNVNDSLVYPNSLSIINGYTNLEYYGCISGMSVINHYVKKAGMINSEKLLKIMENYYDREIGEYGRLLVNSNYSIVSDDFIGINKNNLYLFDSNKNINENLYNLNINCIEKNLRNVFIPRIKIHSNSKPDKYAIKKFKDKFYNCNLSKYVAYRMDK